MNDLLLYKTFILRSLITMLADDGIVITTAAAVDIEKILANTDVEKLQTLSELKYLLSPLLCRNKEDQDKVYKIFDKLDAKIAVDYLKPDEPPSIGETTVKKVAIKKVTPPWYSKKVIAIAVAMLAIPLLLYFFWNRIFPPPTGSPKKINITVTPAKFALVSDTVLFTAQVDSNLQQQNTIVDWRFPDTIINNKLTVSRVVSDTAFMLVSAFLKDRKGNTIDSNTYYFQPVCEIPPSVSISETGDSSAGNSKAGNSQKKKFTPIFTGDTVSKEKYSYKWYVDNSLYSTSEILAYSKPYTNVKLVVNCNGFHCSTDSMVAAVESIPALNASITGDRNLPIRSTYNWKNILMSLLLLILVPSIISSLIYGLILAVKNHTPKKILIEPNTDGPYKIEFNDQRHNIGTETGIRKLADILRKRQVSDIYKLNLRKTIRSTVIAGGIPALQFVPLSKPTNFLVFIDKEKPESFLVKLFEYLADKLQKEEVNIVVYKYFKEPLFLSNEKLNQDNIPLEKIAALYPGTMLFIFGDAQFFLYPLKGIVKPWVTRKLNNWPVKILITPFSNEDWDKKEKLLIDSNFVVLPADLSSLPVLDKIVSGQIDIHDQKKERIEDGYRSRFLNLQDFETLKNYLGPGQLLQWVCSLAIYPSVDWDLAIAIGKAIEQRLQQNGGLPILVNYTNLLKIARISWMQDGIINESLRVQMLTYLDKDTEALARETLGHELHLIEDKINDGSLVKANFDLHQKLNAFLVDSYRNRQIEKDDEAFVKASLKHNRLDEGQDIYLDAGDNSLLSNPFKKEQEVGLARYFKLKSNKQIVNAIYYASAACLALMLASFTLLKKNSGYLNWSSTKPVEQTYLININSNDANKEVTLDLYYEPGLSKSNSQNIRLGKSGDTSTYNDVMIADTNTFGFLKISTIDGQLITQDSFKLNSSVYTISILQVPKTPLKIYYQDATAATVANTIAENLPTNFSASVQQQSFSDTADASVFYFSPERREDGAIVAAAINGLLDMNVQAKQVDSSVFAQAQANIVVYINTPPTSCTPLAIAALPPSLTEIWHGGTSNRLLNINLSKKVMYYSVNDTKTFGAYSIDEICLTKDGAYKVITKTNQGYKLFFIKNVKPKSFELSVCQNFVQSMAELENKDASYCDKFNTMTWYYPTGTSRIYLPLSGAILAVSEKRKLSGIADSIRKNNLSSTTTLYSSATFLPPFDESTVGKILSNSAIDYGVSRAGTPIIDNASITSPDPFQRNYIMLDFKPSPNPPAQPTPNCAVTYTSLQQVANLNNPLIVCKLDLSKAGLTSIPKELFTFINMQQLTLGTTTIAQSEIDQLQKALPRCRITHTSSTAVPPSTGTMDLGTIYFEKGSISSQSRSLMDRIGKELAGNRAASIILEAQYTSSQSQKTITTNINQVVAYFSKMGVSEKTGQITQKVIAAQNPQRQKMATTQKQKTPQPTGTNTENIHVTGNNFPSGFNSSNSKSAY